MTTEEALDKKLHSFAKENLLDDKRKSTNFVMIKFEGSQNYSRVPNITVVPNKFS